MAHSLSRKLDAGNEFPNFAVNLLDGPPTTVKAVLGGAWSILLLYRGHW